MQIDLPYSKAEIQVYTIAKMIEKNQVIIVGTGLPLVASILAKKYFQPSCTLLVESGLMDFNPDEMPRGVADLRVMTKCSVQCEPIRYLGYQTNQARRRKDNLIGFISGAEIDPYGNVSSTCIGDYHHPEVRFPGSGGANGISSFVNTTILMKHEKRRFTEKLGYITSPGWMDGGESRAKCGLPHDIGPQMVITELGIMRFDEKSRRMYLSEYFPFTSVEEIVKNTGFEIDTSRAKMLPQPDMEAIHYLRKYVDPKKIFIK